MMDASPLLPPVRVLRLSLPHELLATLTRITDHLLDHGRTAWDYAPQLAGLFDRGAQLRIPPLDQDAALHDERARVFALFHRVAAAYRDAAWSGARAPPPMVLDDAWLVSQLAGDRNPPHAHDGLISGVLYLRVPQQIDAVEPDGCLRFLPTSPHDPPPNPASREQDRVAFVARDLTPVREPAPHTVRPRVGDLYVFPAWLIHDVPAFAGPGERRSVSFNVRVAGPTDPVEAVDPDDAFDLPRELLSLFAMQPHPKNEATRG
jgi:hypothetical protein